MLRKKLMSFSSMGSSKSASTNTQTSRWWGWNICNIYYYYFKLHVLPHGTITCTKPPALFLTHQPLLKPFSNLFLWWRPNRFLYRKRDGKSHRYYRYYQNNHKTLHSLKSGSQFIFLKQSSHRHSTRLADNHRLTSRTALLSKSVFHKYL